MDQRQALDRLMIGAHEIAQKQSKWKHREDNYRGEQELPFAPEGVNQEYLALREQAIANWLGLAMDTPVQRVDVAGFKKARSAKPDRTFWENSWTQNGLSSRFRLVLQAMMVHDFGVMSSWPNKRDAAKPIGRVENGKRVHIEPDAGDPTRAAWSVKTYVEKIRQVPTSLILPAGVSLATTLEHGFVYDDVNVHHFTRRNGGGQWELKESFANPLGEQPFDQFSLNEDADGGLHPAIAPLIPQQYAINTIRFNALLAMQFSAYRQRVFTAYDPVLRGPDGQPLFETDADGHPILDPTTGLPKPRLNSPGRIGVDRALVFPGKDTKVFDLPESNLNNYIVVLTEFLTQFFATAQIPPQYLLNKMANLSGDAMDGAESTLQALISDIWQVVEEGLSRWALKMARAAGASEPAGGYNIVRGDGEVRSFAQTIDGIQKLISVGFPQRAAFEMIPGANPTKVDDWMKQREEEDERQLASSVKAIAGADPVVGD